MANPRSKSYAIKRRLAESTKCYYCNRNYAQYGLQKVVEHFIPLSEHGTNFDTNKTIACRQCDQIKGNKHPNQVKQMLNSWLRNPKKRSHKPKGYSDRQIARIILAIDYFKCLHE